MNTVLASAPVRRPRHRRPVPRHSQQLPGWLQFTAVLCCILQFCGQVTPYHTSFGYGANSGGNVFDSSSFKPTSTVDPRGFMTVVNYDALYRPVARAVIYDTSGSTSSTSTQYDNVGNPTLVIDPVNNRTATQYDALNRPTLVTYADHTTRQIAYTSTGFKWQVIDENGHVTQTQYDAAGRPTSVTAAADFMRELKKASST